jgi:hypothetical protein
MNRTNIMIGVKKPQRGHSPSIALYIYIVKFLDVEVSLPYEGNKAA